MKVFIAHANRSLAEFGATLFALGLVFSTWTQDKPNILIIWGDDTGWFNDNAYV